MRHGMPLLSGDHAGWRSRGNGRYRKQGPPEISSHVIFRRAHAEMIAMSVLNLSKLK